MNTATDTNPTPSKSPARRDLLGSIPKAHDMRSITADQVAILGLDIEQDVGLPEGAWLLCDLESNESEPSKELRASIYSSQKVNQPIKVVPVPVTPAIAQFEARGKKGEKLGIVLLAVWGRHRVRAVRAEQREGKPIQFRAIVAGADETFQELALQAVIENATELRRRLLPIREARELGKLRDSGMTAADIARRVGLSEDSEDGEVTSATIRNKLALLNLGQSIADLVDSGKIGVTHAYVIGKAPHAHHARLADDAMQGHTVAQLQKTVRELVARDESPEPAKTPASKPEASSDEPGSKDAGDSNDSNEGEPATGTAPTRTKRPKLADVAEMAERLAGLDNDIARAALAALRFVQGEQTEEQMIMEISKLMGHPFPAKPE